MSDPAARSTVRPRSVWVLLAVLAVVAGLTLYTLIGAVQNSLPGDKPGFMPGTLVGVLADPFLQLISAVAALLSLVMLTLVCTALYGVWAARPWTTGVAGTLAGLLLLVGGITAPSDLRAGLAVLLTALVLAVTLLLDGTQTYLRASAAPNGSPPRAEWPDRLPEPDPRQDDPPRS
jgi:hypothetical protein